MAPEGVTSQNPHTLYTITCARLRIAHVTPSGVTSQNPHTI